MPESVCRSRRCQSRMRLGPRYVHVTSTGSQVTLALCEQRGWLLGLYHEEQDTQNVGGDRPSHSMSHMRECGETTASPKEVGDEGGVGPGCCLV